MANASQPKRDDAAAYVDFDEFIDFQLAKTRSGIKSTDLLTALIGGAAAVLGYVLVFALLDHWIIDGGFSTTTRVMLLSLLVLGLVGWAVWKLVLPYFRTITPLYAARQIEQTQPDLQNSLLTLVDLKRAGRPVPQAIEGALEKRSALNLSHMDIEEAVDRRLLMRLSYVLFVLVVLTCAYVLFSPKKLSNSLWRALLPASNVAVATRTRIDNVSPGDVEVLTRAQLTVTADISGQVPDDVTLLFTTADRRFVDEPVAMRQTDEGLQRFSGIITGENGAGILQNLTYRVTAGDARSDEYMVTVKQPPSATVQQVTFDYPDYMGLDSRTQSGGAIDAWEGTWVEIKAKANMPLESAMVLFSDSEDTTQRAEEIPAEIADGVDITARWQLRIRSDGTAPAFYRIGCTNEAGETDVDPTLYPVKIRPDLPPRIELVQPTGDIERPANAIVPLLYAAADQDFLLRSVVLHLELNGEPLPQQPRLYRAPPFRKSVHDVHNLELESLELSPGDRLTYWLQARDNMEPFADRSGNRANTPKLNITITEPASDEQVQQQLEEDQQQVADRLEEARQQADQPPGDPQREPPAEEPEPEPTPEQSLDQPSEPGEQAEENEAAESGQPSGDSGEEGEQRQGGQGQSGTEQATGSDQDAGAQSQQQQGEGDGQSQSQQEGPESFDDLLKELMHRDQQSRQEGGGDQSSPDGQSQPSPDRSQQPPDPGQPSPGAEQPDQSDQGGPEGDMPPDGPGGPSQSPSPEDGQSPSPSPADAAGGSSESMNDQESTSPGTDPSGESPADAVSPDAAPQQPGDASGGEPTPDPTATPPAGEKPTGDGTTSGGQKQPGDDPTGANPGDGNPEAEGASPQADPTQPPESLHDQPGPQPGPPNDRPDARSGGQPDGPDETMQGPGNPEGQRSDQPQTGEGGNSQQTTQGNKGGDQNGPGDSTGQSGTQEAAGEKTGQPGSQKPGAGSEQTAGGDDAGGQEAASDSQQQSGSGQTSPTGEENTEPEMQSDPAGEEPGDPAGDSQAGDEQGGGQQGAGEQGGGEDSGDQAGGGESGGEGGQGDQSGGDQGGGQPGGESSASPGGKPGSPQSDGSPSGKGGGTTSDGGELGPISPEGQGGGAEGPGEGQGTAGESSRDSSLTPEEADLEAKKKAANLVLERLQEQLQRGEIDPELQEDLNLTPERLREFTEKLQQRLAETAGEDTSPGAQARRRQFEQTLRDIDFESTGTTREGGEGPRESASGFGGQNRPAPPQMRDALQRYREQMLKRQR